MLLLLQSRFNYYTQPTVTAYQKPDDDQDELLLAWFAFMQRYYANKVTK